MDAKEIPEFKPLTLVDLKIDPKKVPGYGIGVPGVNNEVDLTSQTDKLLGRINELFTNEKLRKEILEKTNAEIQRLSSRNDDVGISSRDALKVFGDFAQSARPGNERSAVLAFDRASRESAQDAIARSGESALLAFDRSVEKSEDEYAYAFFELSRMRYGADHGGAYQTAEAKNKLDEAKARAAKITVS